MKFMTVGSDLEAAAASAVSYFRERGYSVKAEPYEFDYPFAPTIRCKRGRAVLFVEATSELRESAVEAWVSYARSRDHETLFALLVRAPPGLPFDGVSMLRSRGVGLFSFDGTSLSEVVAPADLALNIAIPDLKGLKPGIRNRLTPCLDKIERGEWLDGFRDCCQVLEEVARDLLKDGARRGRVFRMKGGKPTAFEIEKIARMTQGQLARAYGEIINPTQLDNVLCKALKRVNEARVKAVHKTQMAKNNTKVRVQVNQHLWTIVSALRQV